MRQRQSAFFYNVLKIIGGTGFAQLLLLLSVPFLARLFKPEAFGIAEVVLAIAGSWNVVSSLGYERALILPKEESDAAKLFILTLVLDVLSTIVLAIVIYLAADIIAGALNLQEHVRLLMFVPVLVFFNGFYQAFDAWNTRTKEFGRSTRFKVITTGCGVSTQMLAGLAGYVYAGGLLLGKLAGSGVTCTFLGRAIWRQDAHLLRKSIRVKEIFSLAGRYWKFPVFNIWGSLLNTLSWQAPIWLLAAFFSPGVVGYYAVGNRLVRAPMTLVGRSVAQVFFREASESEHEGRLGSTVDSVFRRLVSFGLLPAILIFFVGEELFAVLLGEPWREAGVYTQILAPFVFFWFISSPLSQLINVKERQGTGVLLQAAILIFRVVPLIIGGQLGDARFAIILFSISGAAVYGFLSWWLVGIAGGSRRSAFRVIMKYGFQFTPAVVILTAAELWMGIGQWSLLGLAAILGSVYLVWLIYEDRALRRSLQPLIQRVHRFHW